MNFTLYWSSLDIISRPCFFTTTISDKFETLFLKIQFYSDQYNVTIIKVQFYFHKCVSLPNMLVQWLLRKHGNT